MTEMSDVINQVASNEVSFEKCSGTAATFPKALLIWINKPHVVNRRLCGSRLELAEKVPKHLVQIEHLNSRLSSLDLEFNVASDVDLQSIFTTPPGKQSQDILCEASGNGNETHHNRRENTAEENNLPSNSGTVTDLDSCIDCLKDDETLIIVRQLLPKQPERHRNIPELILFDSRSCSCTFLPLKQKYAEVIPEVVYSFTFTEEKQTGITLRASSLDCSVDSERKLSLTWIRSQLLQKLARWSEQTSLRTHVTSLCCINLEEYSSLYSELKNKYGLHFAKIWPEKTDPQKFVFEDVAIATYLLCLWSDDRRKKGLTRKQSFVDLGCGNGLLVHILASEGHPGYGVDVRRRNIWDLYGSETVLKEVCVTPSDESVFPEIDWLIGNHSDELTPWIPLMASRSSYTCNYFVLPCCFWDFNCRFSFAAGGAKCERGSSREDGKYRMYLDYIRDVGRTVGFNVEEDTLRIPSTKRVCFIGRSRSYEMTSEDDLEVVRCSFLQSRCNQDSSTKPNGDPEITTNTVHNHSNGITTKGQGEHSAQGQGHNTTEWISDFTPRSKVETTRNCVTISEQIKSEVVGTVFRHLLEEAPGQTVGMGCDGGEWRKGGVMSMGQVVALSNKDLLLQLKNECGGLQTLLRNHCHIFQVNGGNVCLRDFTLADPFEGRCSKGRNTDKSAFVKTTMCWFHDHHPNGCPKSAEQCAYAHGAAELRAKPAKVKT